MDQFGHGKGTIYGGCSEYTIIPAKYAYLLTTDLTDSQAALLERKLQDASVSTMNLVLVHGDIVINSYLADYINRLYV